MIVTAKELKELFRVKDERTLKTHLLHKVTFLGKNGCKIKDQELKELLEKAQKEGGVMTTDEVCAKYGVTEGRLIHLVRNGEIPSFKLIQRKGSQHLFFRSEIEDTTEEIIAIRTKRAKKDHIRLLMTKLSDALLKDDILTEKEAVVFSKFYTENKTIQEVATILNYSKQRISQLLYSINRKLLRTTYEYLDNRKQLMETERKLEAALSKYTYLVSTLGKQDEIAKDGMVEVYEHKLYYKFNTDDLSVRACKCLNRADIFTLADLMSIKKDYLRKLRNLGEKTYQEIVAYAEGQGLIFGTDPRVFGVLTTTQRQTMQET